MRHYLYYIVALLLMASSLSAQTRRSGSSRSSRQRTTRTTTSSTRRSTTSSTRRSTTTTQQRVQNLQQQRTQVERGINQSRQQLSQAQHAAERNSQSLDFIETQLQNRLTYIDLLQTDMDSLDLLIADAEANIQRLDSILNVKQQRYKHSLRHARATTASRNPVLYMMASDGFDQMYRRMRHTREYAAYQRTTGYQLLEQQNLLRAEQNRLLQVKQEKSLVLQEMIGQRQQLARLQNTQRRAAQQLAAQQQDLQKRITQQQKQLAQLNQSIDAAIAEMERERQRQAEEAARRAAAARKRNNSSSNRASGSSSTPAQAPATGQWLTAKDRQLNGSLEQNKGRLPVPITGSYRIYRRHGMNQVAKGVMLENRGIDYMGRQGAQARAVFDGEVSRVIQIGNTKHVLVRHGSYISVYSNLSSVVVHKGQQVTARQTIGTIAANDEGLYILQFQLRKETAKLNPEQWIAR